MASWAPPIFAQPQPTAADMAQLAQTQLVSQPQRFPTSYNTPEADAAAMSPETWENPIAHNLVHSVINGLMAPGRALASTEPMTSDQMIAPAMDMAGLATGGAGVVPAEANSLRMGIKAYHGSPHNFDRFSLDKIGTGEGAQAYGHGLYFAENEAVAQQYRDQLRWKGADFNDPQTIAQNALDRHGDREAAANSLQSAVDSTKRFHGNKMPQSQADANASVEQAIAALRGNEPITGAPPTPGHMYEADINADPEHFLDWDKPLSEQHPKVQDAVKQTMGPNWDQFKYANAGDAVKQGFLAPGADTTAGALREAGIPGIKYLDQGSRAAGDGSRNYVLFDDKLVNIARKYGLAGLAAPPIFAAAQDKK